MSKLRNQGEVVASKPEVDTGDDGASLSSVLASPLKALPLYSHSVRSVSGMVVFDRIQLEEHIEPGVNYRIYIYDETKAVDPLEETYVELHVFPKHGLRTLTGQAHDSQAFLDAHSGGGGGGKRGRRRKGSRSHA